MTHQDVYAARAARKAAQAAGWRTLEELAAAAGVDWSTFRVAMARCEKTGRPLPPKIAAKLAAVMENP